MPGTSDKKFAGGAVENSEQVLEPEEDIHTTVMRLRKEYRLQFQLLVDLHTRFADVDVELHVFFALRRELHAAFERQEELAPRALSRRLHSRLWRAIRGDAVVQKDESLNSHSVPARIEVGDLVEEVRPFLCPL